MGYGRMEEGWDTRKNEEMEEMEEVETLERTKRWRNRKMIKRW